MSTSSNQVWTKLVVSRNKHLVFWSFISRSKQCGVHIRIRDTVPEIIDPGPMCITDLFHNKSLAYFNPKIKYVLSKNLKIKNLTVMLCNFLVRTLGYFLKETKIIFWPWKNWPQKYSLLMAVWRFFFSAAPTAQYSSELNIRFIDSCIQWSVVLYLGLEYFLSIIIIIIKLSKFRKQFFLFSFEPKNERNYFLISALFYLTFF